MATISARFKRLFPDREFGLKRVALMGLCVD